MCCKINSILPNIYFTNLYSTGSIVLEEHLSRRITSGLKPKSRWQWEAWDSELQVTTPQLLTPHLSSPHTPWSWSSSREARKTTYQTFPSPSLMTSQQGKVKSWPLSAWLVSLRSRVAEVAREHGWHPPKSLDSDENFKPEHTLFCRELRFVAIYALFFGDLWA